jgi:maltose alpha-D-glucosyltransferase/alpha-amylase
VTGARKGLIYDGLFDDGTCNTLLARIQDASDVPMRSGRLRAFNVPQTLQGVPADSLAPIIRPGAEQSNTSVLFDHQLVLKMFRRIEPGVNPDVEVTRFLTERAFTRIPLLAGAIEYEAAGEEPSSVTMLGKYVWNQGNGWGVTMEEMGRYMERAATAPPPQVDPSEVVKWMRLVTPDPPAHVTEAVRTYLATADVLGRRTGELHAALATGADEPAFAPEPFDVAGTAKAMRQHADDQLALLARSRPSLDERRGQLADRVLERADDLRQQIARLEQIANPGRLIRCHGDYHLGQVLVAEGDIVILDFEGEPARSLTERRARSSPMRDVAGMIRSFGYAALTGLEVATKARPEDAERLAPWAQLWETWVSAAFMRAYLPPVASAGILPTDWSELETVLHVFVVDKALYELGYELNSRPEWVHVPLTGLLQLIQGATPGGIAAPDAGSHV